MTVHAVASIEAGTSGEWQAALLAYSWRRLACPVPLTILCAGGAPSEPIDADVFVHSNWRGADGGNYAPWNKPGGLTEWCADAAAAPTEDCILLIDADVVLLQPLPPALAAAPGSPWGQPFGAEMRPPLQETWVRNLTPNPGLLQPVGIPNLLATGDLMAMLPRWLEQLAAVRAAGQPDDHWVAEMIGYQLAAADLGLFHELWTVDCGPELIHYYGGNCGLRHWHKATYHPWEPVTVAADASPVAAAMAAVLNEYAAIRRGDPN